ncbi:MAG: FAD-dependent oxidoreductase [Coriobacteriia bacterium]|nr:FAD-dependent oxidoreductase [Coriobacteriia bacterium]
MKKEHGVLFEPIRIGTVAIKNRLVMAPMGPAGMSNENGVFNQRGVDYYVERARGGVGLIISGTTCVEDQVERRKQHMPFPRKKPGEFSAASRLMLERVHAYDTKFFVQLTAGFGRVLSPALLREEDELVGPSMNPGRWIPTQITREITVKEIKSIVKAFGESAEICRNCGYDGIQIHAVHEGYLLDQFATPFFNRRTDEYGGSLENRIRFAVEVVEEIKARCGDDFPVTVRYSPKHFIKDWNRGGLPGEVFEEKGRDLDEGVEMAKLLEEAGYDAFDVDVGSYDAWYWSHPPMFHEKGMYLPYSELMKKHLKTPVITAGRMDDPDLASAAINNGMTDLIALARPLLADPYWPRKIREEKLDEIRPCLSCHDGCLKRMSTLVSCAVNPSTGREAELRIEKAAAQKKVLVIGGGIAGCEAARVCALRGHAVTVYEKNDALGGNLIPSGIPDFKENDRKLVKWYEGQLKKLGVQVLLGTLANRQAIDKAEPDVVVVATGSTPKLLSFPGSDNKNVMTASDALMGKAAIGENVVMVGGGLVGCETALWLAKQGKQVTIVEFLEDILFSGKPFVVDPNEQMLRDLLDFNKVEKLTSTALCSYDGQEALVKTKAGEMRIPADSVILSVGYDPSAELYQEIRGECFETYLLGDCKSVKTIMSAIWEANEVARSI